MSVLNISNGATLPAGDFSAANNDVGTVKNGGSGSGRFNAQNVGDALTVLGGSIVASGASVVAVNDTAYNAGRFANMVEGEFVVMGITNTLAGQANTALASPGQGGNDPAVHEIYQINSVLTATAIRNKKYNAIDGTFDSGFPETSTSGMHDISQDTNAVAGSDEAIGLGYGQHGGELTFQDGSNTPITDEYNVKTG